MNDLENRLQHFADMAAIRHLKHYYYCHCVDRAIAGEAGAMAETLSRFADDIVADFTGFPLAEGRAAVSAFYAEQVPSMLSYSQHQVFNEVIAVNGDQATGLWYVNCPVNFTAEGPFAKATAGLIVGRYEEEYVRADGVWKWRRIVALLDVMAPVEAPWAGATQLFKNR